MSTETPVAPPPAVPLELRIVEVIREMLLEQGKERLAANVRPNSSLERDLGLQSLDLVELVVRLETKLDVEVPDDVAEQADTPEGFAKAILQGSEEKAAKSEYRITPPTSDAPPPPAHARTLTEVLAYQANASAGRIHVHCIENGGGSGLTASQVLEQASVVARGLLAEGLKRNQAVAILLPSGPDFFAAFFGVQLAGGVPVPIYPPAPGSSLTQYVEGQIKVLENAAVKYLIVFQEVKPVSRVLAVNLRNVDVFTVRELRDTGSHSSGRLPEPSEIAVIQYTSGSTAQPKGCVLTHEGVLANIRAIGQAVGVQGRDAVVSWLPLASDLGLVGCWLFSLYHGVPLTLLPPQEFLQRPESWLWAIHDSRGTLTAAPNFAYDLCARRIPMWTLEGIDLSCLRAAVNAGEAVLPETIDLFTRRFANTGLRSTAILPSYGLAENSVALCIPPPGREPVQRKGVFSVGPPVPGHEVRVVDERNQAVAEGASGRVQFRGPSRCREYQRNPRLTESSIHDGWMDTGDRGFMIGGELYFNGRVNDVIVREGRVLSPEALEGAVKRAAGVKGASVIGVRDKDRGTEKLVVIVETAAEHEEWPRVEAGVVEAVREHLGAPPDDVRVIAAGTLPKTANGKLRRGEARALYGSPALGVEPGAPVVEMTSLWWRNLGALASKTAKQTRQSVRTAMYGSAARAYAALNGGPGEPAGRVLSILGRRATHAGTHLKGPAVIVANRAALLDPLALVSVIRGEVKFAGREALYALPDWIARMLRPLVARSLDDMRDTLRRGGVVVVFPDTPVGVAPRRMRIRLDGLEAAASTGVPIIPVAMQERRGVFVSRGEPYIAQTKGLTARELREQVKEAIHRVYARPTA